MSDDDTAKPFADALIASLGPAEPYKQIRKLTAENMRLRAELAAANARAAKYQSLAAELSDKLNGTPCAEIRWQQERDALRSELAAARDALRIASTSHLTLAEMRLSDKHCEWPSFKCAFDAVMKDRRARAVLRKAEGETNA